MEGDARMGAREGEGSLIINAICMDTCKDRVGSFDRFNRKELDNLSQQLYIYIGIETLSYMYTQYNLLKYSISTHPLPLQREGVWRGQIS